MKKFSDINNKNVLMDFETNPSKYLSNDIAKMDDEMSNASKETKLDGEWEIVKIIDIIKDPSEIKEAMIINAELNNKSIKRGDFIYITALIHRKGEDTPYNQQQMGVIKTRIVDIYNNLFILNTLK